MTRDASSSAVSGRLRPEPLRRATQGLALAPSPLPRCADAARTRGEPIAASAVPYRRYLLLEVPGPWGSSATDERYLGPRVAQGLARATADRGMNVLLIRRPGRQRPTGPAFAIPGDAATAIAAEPRAWALADTSPDSERVVWGSWDKPDDLLGLDLIGPLPAAATASGPQRLALICTNGKRDQCCAVLGRPVAEALAAVPGWDTWECTHLGGHRFAATIMLLPTGDMFGWLDQRSAVAAVERFDAGQFLLPHYRGRSGQPQPVQAALHAAAVRLGDSRRQAFRVARARRLDADERWEVMVSHLAEPGREVAYRVIVAPATTAPGFLSCADDAPKTDLHYTAITFSRVGR